MNREWFVYTACKPIYAALVPFVMIYDIIDHMTCDYKFAVNDAHRKQLKSFGYNCQNSYGFLKTVGCVLYVRYILKIAEEGFDFITVK